MQRKKPDSKLSQIAFFIFGLVFFIFGLVTLVDSIRFTTSYPTAIATVTAITQNSNQKCAVVEFQTEQGQTVQAMTDFCGKNGPDTKVGNSLKIFYLPANLEKVQVDHFMVRWFMPIFVIIFGSLALYGSFPTRLR